MFSQNQEDRMIEAVFGRIGVKTRKFVEFGFGFLQNNTLRFALRHRGSGLYMDGSEKNCRRARLLWAAVPLNVKIKQAWLERENIDELIGQGVGAGEIDLLSIDVDGNDYWLWKAISSISPRVVIAEYNASFGPDRAVTVPYDRAFDRHQKHPSGFYHGMSLAAAEKLAAAKGYSLIGCEDAGVNALFVRKDQAGPFAALPARRAFKPHSNRVRRNYTQHDQENLVYSLPVIEV
jgi:hypothetical protein